jgi:hypothetical protein
LFTPSESIRLRAKTASITHDGISMKPYVNKMTDVQVIELRARIAEREFLLEAKVALDENFISVPAMINFIFDKY